ncbi:hypothetical protein ACHAQA_003135 [Verticillium albo-atrum]
MTILSDLHLEAGHQYASFAFPAAARLLLLGGDIGRLVDTDAYVSFLAAQTARYEKVFLVLGNHEFHGLEHHVAVDRARRLARDPRLASRLVLLDRTRWDDPASTLTVLGCTLWSAIPAEAAVVTASKVSDFTKIPRWTVEGHNARHAEDAAWLRAQVTRAASEGRRVLVATHHAPSLEGTSRPEHAGSPWASGFGTPLLEQGGWEGVAGWVFGHTHFSVDAVRGDGMRLVANQRGYVLPGSEAAREEEESGNGGGGGGEQGKKNSRGFDAAMTITL